MLPKCVVCCENDKKYRCKTCEVPYCSLQCYKKHQEDPCEPPIKDLTNSDSQKPTKELIFVTVDTVNQAQLDQLEQSESLKNLLYNPHLRKLLQEIDSAPDGMKAMRVGMMEPLFVEFADECMKVVEPPPAETNQT